MLRIRRFAILLLSAGLGFLASAQPPMRGPGAGADAGMRSGQPGPWDADVLVYRVAADGMIEKTATFERAGVPTLARLKDGRLLAAHQYFPENDPNAFDKVAFRFSGDDGKTWTAPATIQLEGLPAGMRSPFDPTLVPLPDGKIRLYFTSRKPGLMAPAEIFSAASEDGIHYKFEPGERFLDPTRTTIDCAVTLHQGVFHLYSPDNGKRLPQTFGPPTMIVDPAEQPVEGVGYHAVSSDGLNFTQQDDVKIDGRRHWLGNAQSDGERIVFFGTGEGMTRPQPGEPGGGFWMAASADGAKWALIANPRIGGADPGGVLNPDGSMVVIVTGPPRPGTASANRQMGQPRRGNPPR